MKCRKNALEEVMNQACIVLTTAGSQVEARRIAHSLVERQLVACVNIVPQIESVYRWHGKVESANEWLLVIKTMETNFSRVCEEIKKLHSYELPECIKLEINGGSQEYLRWIEENLVVG
jgi:periplasmic divalent cation tolerance protein